MHDDPLNRKQALFSSVMLLYLLLIIASGIFVEPVTVNSEYSKKLLKLYEKKKIVNAQNPLGTESVPLFFLHLLKHKFKYQRLEKIPSTASTIDCYCVPYYLCDRNLTIVTDGLGSINERSRRCANELEICCKLPITTNATMAPIVTPTTTTTMKPTTTTTTTTMQPTTTTTTTTTTMKPTTTTTTTTMQPTTTTTTTTTTMKPTTTTTTTTTTTMKPTTTTTVAPVVFPTSDIFPTPSSNANCYCVLISQCDPNGMIITSGANVIDPRQQISLCPRPDQVCCTLPITNINPPQVITVPQSICLYCTPVQCGSTVPGAIDPRLPGAITQGGENIYPNNVGPLRNPGLPQACYCVKSWLCTEGNAVAPDGVGIIDPRFTLCQSEEDVCCKPTGILDNRILSPKSINNYIINPVKGGCGIRGTFYTPEQPYPMDSGRTYFAEFPWMVALLTKQGTGPYVFRCGASMINNKALLTAAHCVKNQDINTLVARFGQWNIKNTSEQLPFKETKIQAIVVHPNFYSGGLYHDLSVLILSTPIAYELNIMPICLPQQGMLFVPGNRCYATGWGVDSPDSSGKYQDELHKVDLTIIDRLNCQTRLRNTKLGLFFQLHGSFICAGGEANRDTCRGDGGGPLVCLTTTGQYIQAGIVSWGLGCGESQPGVYTSVSQHRQWIDRQLATYGVF